MGKEFKTCLDTQDSQIRYERKDKIGVGFRVGKLTVVEATDLRRQGYTVWRCRCDCGGEILLDTRYLKRGTVKDCGCGSKVRPGQKDLTDQRFGKLVCIEPTEKRGPSGGVVWRCHCDCGNDCLAVSTQLTSGYKKSCGCLGRPPLKDWVGKRFGTLEVVAYTGKWNGHHYWHCRCLCGCGRELDVSQSALKSGHTRGCASLDRNVIGEYVGRRFGMLVVTAYDGKRDGQHYWRCQCDCGNETVVGQTNLQSGHTKSCGCLQREVIRDNLKLVDGTSVTMIESRKKGPIKTNTSGYNGVYWNRKNGTWTAQITFKGKTYYLGTYPTILEAVEARKLGEEMYDDFLEWYYRKYGQSDARHSLPCQATVSGGESK